MNFIYHMSRICLYVEKRYYLKNNKYIPLFIDLFYLF